MTTRYPTSAWDGDSDNRDSDNAPHKSPDWRDWNQMIAELAAVQTKMGLGAVDGTVGGVTGVALVSDYSGVQKVVFTLTDVAITIAEGGTKEFGSIKLIDFDLGGIVAVGSSVDLAIETATMSETADGDFGLGSVAATDQDLSGTDCDFHSKTTIAQLSGGDGVITGIQGAGAAILAGTGTASDLYLNIIFDQGGGAGTGVLNGTITIFFANVGGDY